MGRGVKTKVEQCAFRRIFFLVRAGVFIERAPAIIAIVELCCVHPVCIPHCQSYLDAFADRFRIYQPGVFSRCSSAQQIARKMYDLTSRIESESSLSTSL